MGRKMRTIALRLPEDLISFIEMRAPPGGRSALIREILQDYRRRCERQRRELEEDL